MAVIISHRIKRKEFRKGILPQADLGKILDGFREGIYTIVKNITIDNPEFRKTLHKYLDLLAGDMEINAVDIYEI